MKAFEVNEPGKYAFIEKEKPHPSDGDVLLKVSRIGFCGSDLNTFRGLNPLVSYPRIVGHEVSGIVETSGKDVPPYIKPGMAVTLLPYTNCGLCSSCLKGRANACKFNQTMGVQRDGVSCEFIVVPWEKIVIPDGLSLDELVLVEPLSVGFHAVRRGKVERNETVAVLGSGMIGIGAIIGAAARTGKVIAIDVEKEKLNLAQKIGAKYTINSRLMDLHNKLEVITNGHGPDVMIEAVGSPQTFRQAVEEVCFAGRIVYIGYAKEEVAFDTKDFVMKELDIMGSRNAEMEDFNAVIDAIRNKTFNITDLITKKIPFDEMGKALKEWSDDPSGITKIVVETDA